MAAAQVDVFVKLTSGKVVPLKVLATDTVASLCSAISGTDSSIPLSRISLKYTDKVLDKSKTVGDYGISKETILKVEVLPLRTINVFIKTEAGKVIPLRVESTQTVGQLKTAIEEKEGVSSARQRLRLGGRELKSRLASLEEAGANEEAVILLEVEAAAEAVDHPVVAQTCLPTMDDARQQDVLASFVSGVASLSKPVEVVFSFDTTGSMYSCLSQVRTKLKNAVERLMHDIPNIKIGVIAHGDYCDQNSSYVIRHQDLTTNVNDLVSFVQNVPQTGGGDSPECYEWVLRRAQQLSWQRDSAKALVVIGDATPHPPSYTDQSVFWRDELEKLVRMGIKVYGVQAQNHRESAAFYEELADYSRGAYITFSHFQLITDMFLAVCYKESSDEQLQAYQIECETEGKMTTELGEVFKALSKKPDSEEVKQEKHEKRCRNIASAWWDPQQDRGSPQYKYNKTKDTWEPYTQKQNAPRRSLCVSSSTVSSSKCPSGKSKSSVSVGSSFSSTADELKVLVIGSGGVGKSALTIQFVQGVFVEEYDPTIEDSYRKAYVLPGGKPVLFDILDTAGCDEAPAMSVEWCRFGDAFMIVYAINDRASFNEVQSLYERVIVKCGDDVPCILVGNKTDLESNREVSRKEGETLALHLGIDFYELCAKCTAETQPAFEVLAQNVISKRSKAGKKAGKKRRRCAVM